jgi:hypothetical protein
MRACAAATFWAVDERENAQNVGLEHHTTSAWRFHFRFTQIDAATAALKAFPLGV